MNYKTVESSESSAETFVVNTDGENVGRILRVGQSFHARHFCRHDGEPFRLKDAAVDYIVGIDLAIEARFAGRVDAA